MPLMLRLIIYLSYLFLFSELILMLTKRSKHKSVKRRGDRGSLVMLWVTIAACLTLGFNLAKFRIWSPTDYFLGFLGLLVSFGGLIIRWTTIIQLKKAFTVDVAINKLHQLKTNGLFKIVRHPSYLGLILILTGFALGMNTIISFMVVVLPVLIVIIYRINVEENLLVETFGEVYIKYSSSTKKLIPFVY
jgi:protein-S-isoprenylcysteine O-methyltransferase Ste14